MRNIRRGLTVLPLLLAGFAEAQTPAQTPATPPDQQPPAAGATTPPAAPTPPKSAWTQAGTDFSVMFDGYVDKNFNDPPSGFNGLRNFDVRANSVHVNMGKITIDHGPAPVGFHLDVGFGQTFDIVHSRFPDGTAGNRDPEAFKYFEQAYISVKPKSWHGVEIDAGEFVTSAGAEVIETKDNWNYSRSLLFAWAIPYYHFGVRASFPIGPHFTGGLQLVQGWNNIYPINSGKTGGLTGAYAWKKATWTNTYYVGPEKAQTTQGIRHLFDTVVQVNPTDHLSYYINFDYGQEKNIGAGTSKWTGIAGAARYSFAKKFAVAGRAEFFDDMDGFSTGTIQKLKEVTLTGEYKVTDWLLSRLEFRNDWSDQYFFEKDKGGSKSQPTILFGMVAFFGPKK